MSCLYGVDLGHAVNFFFGSLGLHGDLNEEPFEGEFVRHKEHSVAVRSRTDLRHEVLLSSRARIRNVLVPHKSSSSMLKNFIRTAAFRDIITHPCLFFKSGRWKFNWLASLREMAQERDVIEIAFFTKHQGWYFKIGDITDRRTGNRPSVLHICECGKCCQNPRAWELTHNLWTFMVWRSFAAIYHLRGVLGRAPITKNNTLWKTFFNLQYSKCFLPESQAPLMDQKLVDTLTKINFALPIPRRPFFRFVVPEVAQWKALTVPDIQKLLAERRLPKSGTKKELLEKLNRFELEKLARAFKSASG